MRMSSGNVVNLQQLTTRVFSREPSSQPSGFDLIATCPYVQRDDVAMENLMPPSVSAALPADESRLSPQTPLPGSPAWWTFYWVLPLMMALPLGWYRAGLASEMPFAASMILWISICLVSWWMSDLLARLLARWFRAWSPAPWSLLIGGYLLNLLASSVYNPWVVELLLRAGLASPTPMFHAYFEMERSLLDPGYLWLLVLAGLPGLACWLAGNFALEAVCGVPRFRSVPASPTRPPMTDAKQKASSGEPAPEHPRFLERLRQLEQVGVDELIAVEAADHYIQVHTTRGKELVHYRFGDALAELEPFPGLQIHRSAWVSDHGVNRLAESGSSLSAVLITGERLAVSQPNRRSAKARFTPRKR